MKMPTDRQRAYVYRVLVAVVPLLIAYGVIDAKDSVLWMGVVSAVLGLGMAAVNTSTESTAPTGAEAEDEYQGKHELPPGTVDNR